MPLKPSGKPSGFGFVQFSSLFAAQRAITGLNEKKLMGRVVVLDWVLSKDKFHLATTAAGEDQPASDEADTPGPGERAEPAASAAAEEELGDGGQRGVEVCVTGSDDENPQEREDEDHSDGEVAEEDDGEEEAENEQVSGNEEAGDIEDAISQAEVDTDKRETKRPSDVPRGCTIFVRNVSYDTSEEQLAARFRVFGPVRYAKLVIDHEMDRPKGTAFVQFMKKYATASFCKFGLLLCSEDCPVREDADKVLASNPHPTNALKRDSGPQKKRLAMGASGT